MFAKIFLISLFEAYLMARSFIELERRKYKKGMALLFSLFLWSILLGIFLSIYGVKLIS